MSNERNPIDVTIYAVGGTAINIYSDPKTALHDSLSHVKVRYIDTSDSNTEKIDPEHLYRFPGLNGGGKDRLYIAEKATPQIPEILKKFKPSKFNIVVFGAGGASGAAVGPLMISELMRQGKNVVVAMVGSPAGSTRELANTINSIQTLANFTKLYNMPLAVNYRQVDKQTSIGQADELIRSSVCTLCALFCNQNHGVDETDLKNFLNYNKVTSFAPTLVNLHFFSNDVELPDHVQAIAQATLYDPDTEAKDIIDEGFPGVAYRLTGRLSENLKRSSDMEYPVNYLITRGDMPNRLSNLKELLKQQEIAQAKKAETIQDFETSTSEDGMVF